MPPDPVPDINATIVSAVNARIEAEVAAALSGDDFLAQYVGAALQQRVEGPDPRGYGKIQVPFLHKILHDAIRMATKSAVERWITENVGDIEAEVAKALRRDTKAIAAAMAAKLVDGANNTYGVNVQISLRMPIS